MPRMKDVFEIRGVSRYDDLIAEQYHSHASTLAPPRHAIGSFTGNRLGWGPQGLSRPV